MRKLTSATIALLLGTGVVVAQNTKTENNNQQESAFNIESVKYHAGLGDPTAMNQLGAWYYSGKNVGQDRQKAFALWREAAKQHNPKAISNLGVCYQYGIATPADSALAIKYYVSAIELGHSDLFAQRSANVGKNAFDGMLIGFCNEHGIGTNIDIREAARAYRSAADMGSRDALAPAARTLLASGDKAAAMTYARKAADAGIVEGEYLLATLTEQSGIDNVDRATVDHYLHAAANGYSDAASRLGRMLIDHNPLVKDDSRYIVSLLGDAAASGNSDAMVYLAICQKDGLGIDRNLDNARSWLAVARSLGNTLIDTDELVQRQFSDRDPYGKYLEALKAIDNADFNTAKELAKVLDKAKIAEGKLIEALMLLSAANPKADASKAVKILDKIAPVCPQAAVTLAGLYRNATGVKPDRTKALALLKMAAEKDYAPALNALGDIFFEGTADMAKAPRMAAEYYLRALKQRRLSQQGATNLAALAAAGDVPASAPQNLVNILSGYEAVE